MNAALVEWIISGVGALVGVMGGIAAISNARAGRQNTLIETARFMQDEVERLSNENKTLRKENQQLRRLLERAKQSGKQP